MVTGLLNAEGTPATCTSCHVLRDSWSNHGRTPPTVLEFAGLAAAETGAYVHVITEGAPAARATGPL